MVGNFRKRRRFFGESAWLKIVPGETPEPEPEPEPEEIDLSNVRGGTNQNDAVLFLVNTKIIAR